MFNLNMLNAFYRRALSVTILVYILLFSINLHFIPVSFFIFVNCVMVFFAFFSCFFTKCSVLNGDVVNNYVLGL